MIGLRHYMIKNIITFGFIRLALIVLLSLGFWQIQRLQWKNEIIEKLDIIYAQDVSDKFYEFDDLSITDQELPILYGSVQGRFIYNKEILLGPRPFDGAVGYNVITPLQIKEGYVLVNRGFIDADQKDNLEQTRVNQRVTVSGLFRVPDWNRFTPNNNPAMNIWSKLDLNEIATYQELENVAPVLLYAEEVKPAQPILKLQQSQWMPRNKHLQYAIFWNGMALLLGVLTLIYIKSKKIKA